MNKSIKKQIQEGLDLLNKENWIQAVTYFQELRNQSQEEAYIYYLKSFGLQEMNFIDEAQKSLKMALKIDPQIRFNIQPLFSQDATPIVQILRCVYLISEKKYPNAMFICDQILSTQPQYLPALYQKAQILFLQGKLPESLNLYDKILQQRKDYLFALLRKCQIYEYVKNYQEGLKLLQQAEKLHPLQKCIYFQKGKVLDRLNQIKECLFIYDLLLQIDKTDSQIYIERGICLVKNKEYETAIWCFDKATTLAPDQIYDLTIKKGQALVKQKQYKEAIKLFDQCINNEPENYEGYLQKSYALYEMNDFEIALINCNIALDLRLDIKEAFLLKGNIILKQQFSLEAIQYYDYVIENFEDNFLAYLFKSRALGLLDEQKGVIELSIKIVNLIHCNMEIIPQLPFDLILIIHDFLLLHKSQYSEIYQRFLREFKQYNSVFNINDQEEEQILKTQQNFQILWNKYYFFKGLSLSIKENYIKSIQFFDIAIQLDKDIFQLKFILMLSRSHSSEVAKQYFNRLLSEISQDIFQIMTLGMFQESLTAIQKAVELLPENFYVLRRKYYLENFVV